MSGRIRSIKPEWLEDERMALASPEARVLSIALMLLADDYGNGRASRVMLAGQVFPGKVPETLAKALDDLSTWFVTLYEVDGQSYFHIRNWEKHQKVDKPGKPRVPKPCATLAKVLETPANSLETLAPDRDLDLDHDPTTEEDDARAEIPCPADLELTDGQRGSLLTSGIPEAVIAEATRDFRAKYQDGSEPRTLAKWRRGLVTACSRAANQRERTRAPPKSVGFDGQAWLESERKRIAGKS